MSKRLLISTWVTTITLLVLVLAKGNNLQTLSLDICQDLLVNIIVSVLLNFLGIN